MAFDTFTALLGAADFPFVTDFFARPAIIVGLDGPPKAPRSYTGDKDNYNPELAQHFYCQNVMPTAEGIMSIGYSQLVPAIVGATDFDQQLTLRDGDENNFLFVPARGQNYVYTQNAAAWQSLNPFVGWSGDIVSRSYVNGRTFICYQRKNIFEYDRVANTFNAVPFTPSTGVPIASIDGISNSNNYLIWWSGLVVGWSSLIDPTDLSPNINTGAGSAIPQDVKGPIRSIVPVTGGFIIYTTKNAVSALYTNNARAPFVFREISNAGGILLPDQVTQDGTLGFHYAWTSNGLQKITTSGAEVVNTAVTDFLAGRIMESFDLSTLLLTITRLNAALRVKVSYVAGRYLVLSYGIPSIVPQRYTHALILDLSLRRWGKVQIDHVHPLSYPYPNFIGKVTSQPPKESLAFLQLDGTIKLMLMDYRDGANEGVLLLGRYQLARSRMINFQYLELETLQQPYPPAIYLVVSLNGKTLLAPVPLQLTEDSGNLKKYGVPANGAQRVGTNISILAVGTFELSTAVLTFLKHGNR